MRLITRNLLVMINPIVFLLGIIMCIPFQTRAFELNYRFLTGIVLANIKCFEEGCLFVRLGFLLDILFSMFQRLMVICCLFAWHLLPFVLQMLKSNLTIHQVNEPFYIPSNKCHSNIGLRRILHINSNFNIFIFSCLWYQICQEFCIGPTRIFESPFG